MNKKILIKGILFGLILLYAVSGKSDADTSNTSINKSKTIQPAEAEASDSKEALNKSDEIKNTQVLKNYGNIPLYFIRNDGQINEKVKYYEKGNGHATYFTKDGVYFSMFRNVKLEAENKRQSVKEKKNSKLIGPQSDHIKLSPIGANSNPEIITEGLQNCKVNYFKGNDPKKWRTNIPTYSAVVYKEIYDDIDMKFYGNNRQMEYDLIVKPGADPTKVMLSYEKIKGLKMTNEGDMEISLEDRCVIQKKPYIYQKIDGKVVVLEGSFRILNIRPDNNSPQYAFGFNIPPYDKKHELIIDPILLYSTYLGGSDGEDGLAIAVDSSGNAYVTGSTGSNDFPTTPGVFQTALSADLDAFVTKINSSGSAIIYSTYLGGNDRDRGWDIAVDNSGNAFITGETLSNNFPISQAYQSNRLGPQDVFITKLNATGSALIYSTYLGGYGYDTGHGISVDNSGNAYVTGNTDTSGFPLVNPIQNQYGGGTEDAFVTKIASSGATLIYSTFLGGNDRDRGWDIAVDNSGYSYISGYSLSNNFPTTQGAYQEQNQGNYDAFVVKINPSGTAFTYSTYLGGNDIDHSYGIACDNSGNSYVTGYTRSSNFPIILPAIQNQHGGGTNDVFVTKLNPLGANLSYSTFLGGNSIEEGKGIAVDVSGNAYITGHTSSNNFPTINAFQTSKALGQDSFISKIDSSGLSLSYSSYLGGNGDEQSFPDIAVDGNGIAYVTGSTNSTDFPTVNPIQQYNAGINDVYVSAVGIPNPTAVWVDFNYSGTEDGTFDKPYDTLAEGVDAVSVGGEIFIKASTTSETLTITKAMTIKAWGGAVTIGTL